jgi:hypothetical protein
MQYNILQLHIPKTHICFNLKTKKLTYRLDDCDRDRLPDLLLEK